MRVRIRQLNDVFAIETERFPFLRLDDDGTIGTVRLLKSAMAVEPVGTSLNDRKAVCECLSRRDAVIADPGHAVLLEGKDQAMPMDRSIFREIVGDIDDDIFPLLEAENGARRGAVIADSGLGEVARVDGNLIDRQIVGPGQGGRCRRGHETQPEHHRSGQECQVHDRGPLRHQWESLMSPIIPES